MSRSADDDVDFVVGGDLGPDALGDEELPQPMPPRDPRMRRTLAVGGVVLVAAALIARAVSGHHASSVSPASSSSSASPSPSPSGPVVSGRFHPPPDVVGSAQIVIPEGNRPTFGRSVRLPATCPADATCSINPGTPAGVLAALLSQFPGGAVVSSSTVLANRTGRFEPDLVARTTVVHAGSRMITVKIRKPRPGDVSKTGRLNLAGTTTSYRVAVVRGFTVRIEVLEPRSQHPVSLDRVIKLAADTRLVEPQ